MEQSNSSLQAGSTLQMGKYRIDKFLSAGGFGIAYMATNVPFAEKVAIKEFFMKSVNLRGDDSTTVSVGNPQNKNVFLEQKAKFVKEAKRIREFHNKHIVHVSDLFEENGTAYYVMDYIDGESLDNKVKANGKLPEKEVIKYLDQILDALEEVHDHQMLHLDLKPSNIMVDNNGQILLIDFGASKQQKADGSGATANSALTHTPGYAPLEQMSMEFENFGPWTDLYSLGATLYNLLTGNKPPTTSRISDLDDDAFEFPESVSLELQGLIIWMMNGPRIKRPQSVERVRIMIKDLELMDNLDDVTDDNVTGDVSDDDVTILNGDKEVAEEDEDDKTILNNEGKENSSQQQPVIQLKDGKDMSVAKVLPDTIGDIIYFDTTNINAEPSKTRAQYITFRIISVVVTTAVLGELYYLAVNDYWDVWLCGGLAFFTFLGGIVTFASQVFDGTDFFIGLKGFAVFKFKNERDNLVNAAEIKFDDFDYLLHEETDVYEDKVYQHTTYKFSMLKSKKAKEQVFKIEGSYVNKDNYGKDIRYTFGRNLENMFTSIRYQDVVDQLLKKGSVEFVYFGPIRTFTFDIVLFVNGDIKVDGMLYKYDEIDSITCSSGNLIIRRNTKNDKYELREIELGAIGNRLLFLEILSKTNKKMHV